MTRARPALPKPIGVGRCGAVAICGLLLAGCTASGPPNQAAPVAIYAPMQVPPEDAADLTDFQRNALMHPQFFTLAEQAEALGALNAARARRQQQAGPSAPLPPIAGPTWHMPAPPLPEYPRPNPPPPVNDSPAPLPVSDPLPFEPDPPAPRFLPPVTVLTPPADATVCKGYWRTCHFFWN